MLSRIRSRILYKFITSPSFLSPSTSYTSYSASFSHSSFQLQATEGTANKKPSIKNKPHSSEYKPRPHYSKPRPSEYKPRPSDSNSFDRRRPSAPSVSTLTVKGNPPSRTRQENYDKWDFLSFEEIPRVVDSVTLPYALPRGWKEGDELKWTLAHVNNENTMLPIARQHQVWDLCRLIIDERIDQLRPASLLEAAHSMAEIRARNLWLPDDNGRLKNLEEKLKSSMLPPVMQNPYEVFLSFSASPSSLFSPTLSPNLRPRDCLQYAAIAALNASKWDQLESIYNLSVLGSPLENPLLLHNIANYLKNNKNCRVTVANWLYSKLIELKEPVHSTQKRILTKMNRLLGVDTIKVDVSSQGTFSYGSSPEGSKQHQLPIVNIANEVEETKSCRDSLATVIDKLVKVAGSVTESEVRLTRSVVDSLAKNSRGNQLLVVDTLNVAHQNNNNIEMYRMISRLSKAYGNLLLVTRDYLEKRLTNYKYAGNVKVLTVESSSEDDIVILLAALYWKSPEVWILSNDKYEAHIQKVKVECGLDASIALEKWIEKRKMSFEKKNFTCESRVSYSRAVHRLSPSSFYVPIVTETESIWTYLHLVAQLPSKSGI